MSNARNCVVCGIVDNDPRDQVVLPDQTVAFHHMDCGSRLNPPCESCTALYLESGKATGDKLKKFLTKGH